MVYWLLPQRFRNYHLLISSYLFYFSYNPWFLILLFGTSAFDYWCALKVQSSRVQSLKKLYLSLSVISNIGVLVAFKYVVFFYNTSITLFGGEHTLLNSLIIPAGLSFYTFQSLSYTIDVYRGKYKADDTFFNFLLYVSFFPHMVAGPVVRYNSLMPQFKVAHYFKNVDWEGFAKLCIWGYFKKMVIADNLSELVDPVFAKLNDFNSLEILLGGFLFVIQVYCDFSGYSDIATGVSKLFGINLSLNWRRPLLSRSLREFWTRNHISITTWFRDYVYISLGGNRVNYSRWLFNIFAVFLISALWHGANFTFVIWGAMHGTFYIFEILLKKKFPEFKAPKFSGWLYLIAFHTLSLMAFRASSIADLSYIYRHLFIDVNYSEGIQSVISIKDRLFFYICVFLIGVLFLKEILEEYTFSDNLEKFKNRFKPYAYIILVASIFILGNFNANEFIYFQF